MLPLKSFVSFVALAASLTIAAKHGTIGYGINMYHPWCCTACYDALTMVYLNCTTFSKSSGGGGMGMKLRKRMDMEMLGSTSNECYASSKPYQQTLSYCVKSRCDKEGISYAKQNRCFQRLAAGGLQVASLEDLLPDVAPKEELAEDAMWLNKTLLVNNDYWHADRGTIEAFEKSEEGHVRFSYVLHLQLSVNEATDREHRIVIMTVSVGIPLLTGLWAFLRQKFSDRLQASKLATHLQSQFVLPALFGQRHSQPLPYAIGYVPKRALTIFIIIYVILNVIFSAVPFYSVQPSSWYTNRNQEIAAYVSNRTGVLSFANMALAILFSTRNNPLAYFSGWTHTSFLAVHRWASRVAILQAVVHSIVYTADYCYYKDGNAYYAEAVQPYFWWGIIATTAMGLMTGLSALPLRMYAYELFLVIHIALAILSLLGSWLHVDIRFTKQWGYEVWLYIAFAFWSYDRLVRLLKVVYYSLLRRSSAIATPVPGTNVVSLKIYPGRAWKGRPGGHTYLYFPYMGRFWENHPFTIADWAAKSVGPQTASSAGNTEQHSQSSDTESREIQIQEKDGAHVSEAKKTSGMDTEDSRFFIQCFFRVHSGTTAMLYRTLATEGSSQVSVLTEGPYGGHTASHQSLKQADKVLCIAGGIGITWAAGFAKQFSLEQFSRSAQEKGLTMPRAKRFVLAWSVRERGLLEHVQQHLLPDLAASGLDDGSMSYRFWLTGEDGGVHEGMRKSEYGQGKQAPEVGKSEELVSTAVGRRMDVETLISSFMENGKRHAVLVCGPGGLADAVRSNTVACSEKGYFVDLVEEPFAW